MPGSEHPRGDRTAAPTGSVGRQIAWFIGLWLAGVLAVTCVGLLIRTGLGL